MVLESSEEGSGLVALIEKMSGNKIENGVIELPRSLGKGYIREINLKPDMLIMVHHYQLNKDITLKRNAGNRAKDTVTFSFRNVLRGGQGNQKNPPLSEQPKRILPSIQVSSSDMSFEIFAPAKTTVQSIVIGVRVAFLNHLMNKKEGNVHLQNIIQGQQPYLYDQMVSPEIRKVAAKIVEANVSVELSDFYFRLRAEEMIYLFFVELLQRDSASHYPLNAADAQVMYKVRDKITTDLSAPPKLSELVRFANMSESKMNRLFKQIFGSSIYNYYQSIRMSEAAYLIKEKRFSVSEVGYRMGFSNLSHFSRLFEQHIGMKPKKYSAFIKKSKVLA